MKIEILGTGCAKCKKLFENAQDATKALGLEAEVVKVEDMQQIINAGIMITPAIAVDGEVKSAGKVLSVDEIKKIISLNKKGD
jgi:small redox-active disulfide protein 2